MPGSGYTRAGNAGARPQRVTLARSPWALQRWTHRRDRARKGRKARPTVRSWTAQAPAIDGLWLSLQVERRVGVAGYSWRLAVVELDASTVTGARELRLLRGSDVVQLRDAGQALAVIVRKAQALAAEKGWTVAADDGDCSAERDTSFAFGGAA